MNINKILYPILLLLVVLSSCDYESPLDKEQYKKTLYLIGASSNLVTKELAYSSEVQEGFITVGVSGSLLIDGNVDVTLESHNSVIDWYNKKFKFLATDIKYQGLADESSERDRPFPPCYGGYQKTSTARKHRRLSPPAHAGQAC